MLHVFHYIIAEFENIYFVVWQKATIFNTKICMAVLHAFIVVVCINTCMLAIVCILFVRYLYVQLYFILVYHLII